MRAFLFALISGWLLALSLPPFDHGWLGWLALAPVFIAGRGRRPLEAFGLGLLSGIVCGVTHVGWYPDIGVMQFAYLPFAWFGMLLGIVTTLAAATRQRWQRLPWVLFVAAAATAVEWLTTFSPLPLNLALSQYRATSVIQIAAWTGIWGVSFLLWGFNAALADAAMSRQRTKRWHPLEAEQRKALDRVWQPAKRGRQQAPLVAASTAVALVIGAGFLAQREGHPKAPTVPVAAIQELQVGETARFLPAGGTETGDADREALTRQAAARGAKLVVWTEGGLGSGFEPDEAEDPTRMLARTLGISLVVGYLDSALPKPHNCAALIAPDGRVLGCHRKIHPFLGETRSIQPGITATSYNTPLGKIGMEICFDTCYPAVTRQIARTGARLIAVPNWDPPAPRGVLHRLHSAMLPFRAVEYHVPFARADANGLSQIIDAHGRILAQAPLYAPATLIASVALGDGRGTLYTRWGDWWAYLCLLIVAGFSLAGLKSHVAVNTTSSREAASG